jgi:hypothetical protein
MIRVVVVCLASLFGVPPSFGSDVGGAGPVHYEPRTFLGYACEDDCQQHKLGFRWAEQHAVTDSRLCARLPRANVEGCAAFVDEGRDAETAGDRWAVENEIAHQSDCLGAGKRFYFGCTRQLPKPINTYEYSGNCELRNVWTESRLSATTPAANALRRYCARLGEASWNAVEGDSHSVCRSQSQH